MQGTNGTGNVGTNGVGPQRAMVAVNGNGQRKLVTAENAPRGSLLVSPRQQGNPVLKFIRNVRWTWADIAPDFQIGADSVVLYISLRFHLLNPEYIHTRMRELLRCFTLRVLLCHVDLEDVTAPLQEITSVALHNRFTLVCCFSTFECARYLETYKAYEHKPADGIKGRTEADYESRRAHVLTAVRGVNKTDVVTLGSKMGSVAGVMRASREELASCIGIGPTKAARLLDAFQTPFRRKNTKSGNAEDNAANTETKKADDGGDTAPPAGGSAVPAAATLGPAQQP